MSLQTTIYNTLKKAQGRNDKELLAYSKELADEIIASSEINPETSFIIAGQRPIYQWPESDGDLALTEGNKFVIVNAEGPGFYTITLPLDSNIAHPIGTELDVLVTSGEITIAAEAGATLNGVDGGSITINTVYTGAFIKKTAADTWIVVSNYTVA